MQQGQEIGALARRLYPDGVVVSRANGKPSVQITQELIATNSDCTLFEAEFTSGPFVTRADILQGKNGVWQVLEVKSSFSDTGNIKNLIDDLAYTVMVLRRAGLSVTSAHLCLLSRGYRFGDGPDLLFKSVDKTADVNVRIAEFETIADAVATALLDDDNSPAPALSSACRDCDYFAEACLGAGIKHSVLEIPGLHFTKLKELSAAGIVDLSGLPPDFKLNDRQTRANEACRAGKQIVGPGLKAALAGVAWPCHYLDFETVATVLPLYAGHACHRPVLTQFSIHHRDAANSVPTHSEYLADASKDCENEVADALIRALGTSGSVMVYSSYEKTRIKGLRDQFPDKADALDAVLLRLLDLLPIIQDCIYCPEFRGSFSIKKVLPALVPDLSYGDLEVADGEAAITQFARMARKELVGEQAETARNALLRYCERDTLAMVRLHETIGLLADA